MSRKESANAGAFWHWFFLNADRFRPLEGPDGEQLLDEVEAHLHRYSPHLFFEIGGDPSGPTELVITADGQERFFPAVERLVAAAPNVPGWKIVAFKQPAGFRFVVDYGGVSLDPAACWFLPLRAKQRPELLLGLRIACPGYSRRKSGAFSTALRILLTTALGELRASRCIHHVELVAVPKHPPEAGYLLLYELPSFLDWLEKGGPGEQAHAADERGKR